MAGTGAVTARLFNMLYSPSMHVCAIAQGIDIQFHAGQVTIKQHGAVPDTTTASEI